MLDGVLIGNVPLRNCFSAVVDGHQVSRPKPDPEMYLRVAALLGVEPRNCVVFEDSHSGIEAARAAGARVVGLRTTHKEFKNIELAVDDFRSAELEKWLEASKAAVTRAIVLALLLCSCAGAEPTISLEDAAARKPPDYTPLHEDRAVIVTGQVSIPPVHLSNFFHLAIQEKGHGLVLEGSAAVFDRLSPGDWVEAHGRVSKRGGLPVVVVSKITPVSNGVPPEPVALSPADVQNLQRLGQLVVTEGPVIEVGSSFGGAYLRIGNESNPLKVFLPNLPNSRGFAGFAVGETVRVTGIAYQYCPTPPHLDQFELLVAEPKDVVRLNRSWLFQLRPLWPILVILAAMGFLWWRREVASRQRQEKLRMIYNLGEEILSAATPADILDRISQVLPKVLRVTGAKLYIHDRGTRTLNFPRRAAGSWHLSRVSSRPVGVERRDLLQEPYQALHSRYAPASLSVFRSGEGFPAAFHPAGSDAGPG